MFAVTEECEYKLLDVIGHCPKDLSNNDGEYKLYFSGEFDSY